VREPAIAEQVDPAGVPKIKNPGSSLGWLVENALLMLSRRVEYRDQQLLQHRLLCQPVASATRRRPDSLFPLRI
jgi:hypothetical protein